MRMHGVVLAAALAGCGGGGGATVEGTFAPGAAVPDGVWIVESQRSEPADSAGFRVRDLSSGPVQMRLVRGGDTVGALNLGSLPDGARAVLAGLRVDPSTGLAFPRSVELEGADVLMVNGLRMASADRVPARIDADGAVLGWFAKSGALLLRPADAALPDLRVVVGPETVVEDANGGAGDARMLGPGDSVTVQGPVRNGHVMATRLVVPAKFSAAAGASEGSDVAARDDSPEEDGGGGESRTSSLGQSTSAPSTSAPSTSAPSTSAAPSPSPANVPVARLPSMPASAPREPLVVPRPNVPIARPPALHGNGRGNGNGNGRSRGRGQEKGPRERGNNGGGKGKG
ncbi:hypothetical protein [Longimicrobium terrae]|uniref:Uncharacterized protein n=1 Tax=Longimicrobium terrae TaxID=1639882 RepID=A0A841GX44_9BACT|nr:hypothetical protein [Longimicrobium terrae]MBB4634962.1 hypothetical protein [Longimicrobium terrae]MBB6069356.1 hypothetical protein [Longimicrobium terrae]NNC31836.1 hypothetical protein [Longimicrobium terrae]